MKKAISLLIVLSLMLITGCNTTKAQPNVSEDTTEEAVASEAEEPVVAENVEDATEDDQTSEEDRKAFEIFTELNKNAFDINMWYMGEDFDLLGMDKEEQAGLGDYRKISLFSTADEMKAATQEVFSLKYCERLFYDHAFTESEMSMYKEIDGALYRNINTGGIGWAYVLTDEYYVPYNTHDMIVIAVKAVVMDETETWINFVLKKEDDTWKFEKWYDFSPYAEYQGGIGSAVSSWLCAEEWTDPNQLGANAIINFYIYEYLSDVGGEFNDAVGYEVPATQLMADLSRNFEGLKLETVTAINEDEYASATYNPETDTFTFYITFDGADFVVCNSQIKDGAETLEVLVIDKGGKASYFGYLDVVMREDYSIIYLGNTYADLKS